MRNYEREEREPSQSPVMSACRVNEGLATDQAEDSEGKT